MPGSSRCSILDDRNYVNDWTGMRTNDRPRTAAVTPSRPGRQSRRGQGRPLNPRNAVGREGLIQATIALLHKRPPAKLTLQEIAEFAGVDPKLIRYYFGNKNALFTAAVAEMLGGMQAAVETQLKSEGPAGERIRNRARSLVRTLFSNPHVHPLIVEQIMHGDREAGRQALKFMAAHGYAVTRRIIEDGLRRGELRDVDPRFLHVAMVGLCEYFITARPLVEELFGGRPMTLEMAEAYADFVADLLFRGLARPAGQAT
jgi:TetR/AcrR family transcriptional regulator